MSFQKKKKLLHSEILAMKSTAKIQALLHPLSFSTELQNHTLKATFLSPNILVASFNFLFGSLLHDSPGT